MNAALRDALNAATNVAEGMNDEFVSTEHLFLALTKVDSAAQRLLQMSGVKEKDVLDATDYVCPCFEIVDSRIENWEIKIQDTIADNASCGLFALGDRKVRPEGLDFETCGMVVRKNGKIISTGAGAAVQGSPLTAVAWLANTLGKYGVSLNSGDLILSGSLVPLEPVESGDHIELSIGSGIGNCKVAFS